MKFSIVTFPMAMLCFWCTSGEAISQTSFKKDCLAKHNYYRKLHGVPALQMDDSISDVSKKYAEQLASRNEMKHSGNKKYGENLYMSWSTDSKSSLTGDAPVTAWYSEVKYYKNYNKEPSSTVMSEAGHFTQVLWKGTKKVGCGVAKKVSGGKTQYYVVCNYYPPGNYVGEFTKNVPPPK